MMENTLETRYTHDAGQYLIEVLLGLNETEYINVLQILSATQGQISLEDAKSIVHTVTNRTDFSN